MLLLGGSLVVLGILLLVAYLQARKRAMRTMRSAGIHQVIDDAFDIMRAAEAGRRPVSRFGHPQKRSLVVAVALIAIGAALLVMGLLPTNFLGR